MTLDFLTISRTEPVLHMDENQVKNLLQVNLQF